MTFNNFEVISFASKFSKATGRVTSLLKAADCSGIDSFDAKAIVSGMFAEPSLVSQWLNAHVFVQRPEFRKKLIGLIERKNELSLVKPYEECSDEERDLIIVLNVFHLYQGDTDITVNEFMGSALNKLQSLDFLEYQRVELATTSKDKLNTAYLVKFCI